MVKTPNKRKAPTKAEILLPEEPLFYPPDYRKLRGLLIAAERLCHRADDVSRCKYLPATFRQVPVLISQLRSLATIIYEATAETKQADKQCYLRFTDDWLPEAGNHPNGDHAG